jgi:hypothetical protein
MPWVKYQRPVTRRLINLYTPYNCRLKRHLPTTSIHTHDSHAETKPDSRSRAHFKSFLHTQDGMIFFKFVIPEQNPQK